MSDPSGWQHADPCTCWNDPECGPIIGADCIRAMYAEALEALNHPKPQPVDSVTSATPGSGGQLTIKEFLLARIAEDEAAVERRGNQPHAIHLNDIIGTFRDGCADCMGLRGRARVLDECASKRAIIELAEQVESMDHQIANEWGGSAGTAESILSALAAVYEHHQNYRKEWGNGD